MTMPNDHHEATEVKESLERIERKVDKIDVQLSGNGDPERGLIVQFHRVKQSQEALVKVVWLFVAAFAMAIVTIAAKLFALVPPSR